MPRRTAEPSSAQRAWDAFRARLAAFTLETHPEALDAATRSFAGVFSKAMRAKPPTSAAIDALRRPLSEALRKALPIPPTRGLPEPTPGVAPPIERGTR